MAEFINVMGYLHYWNFQGYKILINLFTVIQRYYSNLSLLQHLFHYFATDLDTVEAIFMVILFQIITINVINFLLDE